MLQFLSSSCLIYHHEELRGLLGCIFDCFPRFPWNRKRLRCPRTQGTHVENCQSACSGPLTWPRSAPPQVNSLNMRLLLLWDSVLGQVFLLAKARRVEGLDPRDNPDSVPQPHSWQRRPINGCFLKHKLFFLNILASCSLKPVFPEHWHLPVKPTHSQDVHDAESGSLY